MREYTAPVLSCINPFRTKPSTGFMRKITKVDYMPSFTSYSYYQRGTYCFLALECGHTKRMQLWQVEKNRKGRTECLDCIESA